MKEKKIFWSELTETQKATFLNDNKEYLFWADGTPISVNELSRFMLIFNGQFWSLTLKDEDFYIENVIFNDMRTKIENFLRELNTEIDVLNYVDVNNIDPVNPFESICEMIEDNGGFDIEIIYYSNAIDFLAKNDPSLTESLEIAAELGFEVQNLNSEILASLLASKLVREEFYELEDEINSFFEELEEEEEEE
jgi:intracellular sulfur oxidation DsrE/DsrF family protein